MPISQTRMYQYAKRVSQLKEDVVFKIIFSRDQIKEEIIYLNTQAQLFDKGINSRGERLDDLRGFGYSDITKQIKSQKGQPTNRITLKDTGDFYESFRVRVKVGEIIIDANPIKDDTNLFEEFGNDVLGLTDESIEKLKPLIIENYKQYLYGLLE